VLTTEETVLEQAERRYFLASCREITLI